MDIHVPDQLVHTWRDFLRHIAVVMVGILIALGLEGALQWHHHRELARQLRENVRREIADNLQRIGRVDAAREAVGRGTGEVLVYIAELPKSRESPKKKIGIDFPIVQLSSASWSSAVATGALGYMPYDEVQRYAAVYDGQQQFAFVQQKMLQDVSAIVPPTELVTATTRELEDCRRAVLRAKASYEVDRQMAASVSDIYRATMTGPE